MKQKSDKPGENYKVICDYCGAECGMFVCGSKIGGDYCGPGCAKRAENRRQAALDDLKRNGSS